MDNHKRHLLLRKVFIRFYFIHSNLMSNLTSQIVPSTKALQTLVPHLKPLHNMFFILSKDWKKLRGGIRSFVSKRMIKNVCFLYFVFISIIETNRGAACLFVLFQKNDKNIWSLFKKCFIFCPYSRIETNQAAVSIRSFPKELLKFLT